MSFEQLAFFVLSGISLGGAVAVVFARSVFVAALWLIVAFLGVAGMYVLLSAPFLAMAQILIYIGAISVLILFGVMLTRDSMAEESPFNRQNILVAMVMSGVFILLFMMLFTADWPLSGGVPVPPTGVSMEASAAGEVTTAVLQPDEEGTAFVPGTTEMLGRTFMMDQLLAFEVISVVLLVALIGAIVIARE